jgi:RNA polymerase primary sigma factor
MQNNTSTAASMTFSARRPGATSARSIASAGANMDQVGGAPEQPEEVASEGAGFLAPYFRDLSSVDVMTRDEELAAAVRISTLRQTFWKSILAYPPFIDGICDLAREVLPAETCPVDALTTMKKASRALRDRDLLVHQKAYEAAREALTVALAEADVDGLVSDRVLADLGSVEAGQNEGLSMKVKLPRRGSLPFLNYVTTVRANHHALWNAKNSFVKANLRLVVTIARRFNHGRLPLQDLIQEGNIGLMKAVDRFDHRKGFRFSTYGSWWIRHAISRSIADKARAVRLPVHMIDAYNKVCRARRDFEALHGRKPTEAELAAATGVSAERLQRMNYSLVENPVSLDQPLATDSGLTLLDAVEDTQTPEAAELMDNELLMSNLRDVFSALSPMEADILRKRMGLEDEQELTLKEIGERYSLSRERIRQLQEQALGKLRDEFKKRALM